MYGIKTKASSHPVDLLRAQVSLVLTHDRETRVKDHKPTVLISDLPARCVRQSLSFSTASGHATSASQALVRRCLPWQDTLNKRILM